MINIDKNLWIFNGETLNFYSFPFTTRMTIVMLSNGDLWVHSPIRLTPDLKSQVDSLGKVKYLISPNPLHHLFLKEWQKAYPDSLMYGTKQVIKKRDDLCFDGTLDEMSNTPWEEDINQLLFTGSFAMQECIFFHKKTNVLIVTDLIENFSPEALPFFKRQIAKFAGVLAPNGKMPIDWCLSFYFRKKEARKHIEKILSWKPKKIILSHGEIIQENAETFLRRSFKWVGLTKESTN
ncbi:hypothetical protein CSA08_03545 [Candidatus Gracilibacteria bacterium]|nr:MAG: hypothetical protein CSA08_03545 [Candidatus Gracilibacteria bacterium]